MKYLAIWTVCFGLLFLFFLTARSKADDISRTIELRQYCEAFIADYPEAMKNDAEAECFHKMIGKEIE